MSDDEKQQKKQARADMAACMARVFLGDADGKRALSYLRERFGIHRAVFRVSPQGRVDVTAAAVADGQRQVMTEIEAALKEANSQAWAESLI